jgi:putative salt-induced outer membrane protein YdiY
VLKDHLLPGRLRMFSLRISSQLLALFCALATLLASGNRVAAQPEGGVGVLPPPGSLQLPLLEPDAALAAPDNALELLPLPPGTAADAGLLDTEAASAITPTPRWYQPSFWFGPLPWDAGLEFGLNGSEGNNNVMSLRAGGHLNRESPLWKFGSSLAYNKNTANDIETQNNAKLDVRLDRKLEGSPWTIFFLENLIYDEFQAYDIQLSLNSGIGYRFIKTDTKDLLGRFGAGATREFGGVNTDWVPQGLFGVDYTHKISDLQRFTAKVDYYPEWQDFSRYRIVTDIGWEIDLDRPKNMSLKLSVIDRYDSTPDGAQPQNLDYAALITWGL